MAQPRTPGVGRWSRTTIRVRLGLALSVALAPVLILSGVQASLTFRLADRDRRAALIATAERSAATARARIAASEVLLQTLAPGSVGFACAARLAEIRNRIPGYLNLIRFDPGGRVACAAATVPADPDRWRRAWFQALARGARLTVSAPQVAGYADQPAVLASVRAEGADGAFAGVLTAVIALDSLRPTLPERTLPSGSEVALADARGGWISSTAWRAFPGRLGDRFRGPARDGSSVWVGRDRAGRRRDFSSAPLVGHEVYVILSAPGQGPLTWAWVNPISSVLLPLLAFSLALTAVWLVADQAVVRWIAYLRRIAVLYAGGRYGVHPLRIYSASPEIRSLGLAMDGMAKTIDARDRVLRESLVEKDSLMREIHHRVKNNLQVISSLLNLQQRALTDPAALAAISDTRQRIGALALIYRYLYQGSDLRRVDLHGFVEELVAQLTLSERLGGEAVHTEIAVDSLIVDPDRLAPIALFSVEAIAEAMKHGLPPPFGRVRLSLKVRGPVSELVIGYEAAPGPAPIPKGEVGRTLMTAFARQLGGEVTFAGEGELAREIRLIFPTPEADEGEGSGTGAATE